MHNISWHRVLVGILLLGSIAEFTVRGPIRFLQNGTPWNDFLSPFIQARAWAHGKNPYTTDSLLAFWPPETHRPKWVMEEAGNGTLAKDAGIPSPYPIVSLVAFSPLTALRWPLALLLWFVISTAAVVVAPFALLASSDYSWIDPRSQLFLAATFALAPIHSGLGTANPAMLAVALGVGSFLAFKKDWAKTAAILLAIAICIKPTVAAGLWLYFAIRRHWKITFRSAAIVVIVGIVGVLRLAVNGVPWLAAYSENTRQIFAVGSIDDFTAADPLRFNMINLKVALYAVLKDVPLTNLAAAMAVLALLAVWFWLCRKGIASSHLLDISAISTLSLMAVYHRFYDAALLIWPLAWSILIVRKRSATMITCLLIAPFFVPGASLLDVLTAENRIPSRLSGAAWWNMIVRPHEAWLIFVICVVLLYFLQQELPERNSLPFPAARESGRSTASE